MVDRTKGEWRYNGLGTIQSLIIGEDSFVTICSITPQPLISQTKANAHLIKASPKLYDNLKIAYLTLIVLYESGWLTGVFKKDIKSKIDNMGLALKEAEGEDLDDEDN